MNTALKCLRFYVVKCFNSLCGYLPVQEPRNIDRNFGALFAFRSNECSSSLGSWAIVSALQKVPAPEVVCINGPAAIRVELKYCCH